MTEATKRQAINQIDLQNAFSDLIQTHCVGSRPKHENIVDAIEDFIVQVHSNDLVEQVAVDQNFQTLRSSNEFLKATEGVKDGFGRSFVDQRSVCEEKELLLSDDELEAQSNDLLHLYVIASKTESKTSHSTDTKQLETSILKHLGVDDCPPYLRCNVSLGDLKSLESFSRKATSNPMNVEVAGSSEQFVLIDVSLEIAEGWMSFCGLEFGEVKSSTNDAFKVIGLDVVGIHEDHVAAKLQANQLLNSQIIASSDYATPVVYNDNEFLDANGDTVKLHHISHNSLASISEVKAEAGSILSQVNA